MQTKKQIKSIKIYEKKGVFGDEKKYKDSSDRLAKMLEIIKTMNPKRLLDIGAGTGYFTNEVKNIFPNLEGYGVDVSKEAITVGSKLYKKIRLRYADVGDRLPFKNSSFDFVVSGENVICIDDTDTYFSEINRVLKKNGKLMITFPNMTSWLNRILIFFGKSLFYYEPSYKKSIPVITLFGKTYPDKSLPPTGILRVFSIDNMKGLMSAYGIEMDKVYGVSLLSKPVIKSIDRFFSRIPYFSSGVILIAIKKRDLKKENL